MTARAPLVSPVVPLLDVEQGAEPLHACTGASRACRPDAVAPRRAARRVTPLAAMIAPWAVLGIVIAAALVAGRHGRRFLERPIAIECAAPQDALHAWRKIDARGRVLVHLDRPIAMSSHAGAAPAESFVAAAVRENRIRRIYHVIPAAEWESAAANLRMIPDAKAMGRSFGIRWTAVDLPIEVLRLSDLPSISEPVLLDADFDRYHPDEQRLLARRLGRRGLRADGVAWRGTPIAELASTLEGLR